MPRYFIEVSYRGTRYSGFQVQENAHTIQEAIETAFHTIHRVPVSLTGSSRTDAGVHALQNYFHFDADSVHPQFIYKMNAILPADIAINNLIEMPVEAHCRFDASSRVYHYRIHRLKDPFAAGISLFYPYTLDWDRMQAGAGFIKNQQYFAAFSKTNTQVKNFNCHIISSGWKKDEKGFYYEIEGNRFLRGMVRQLTAALLHLGRGKLGQEEFEQLFRGEAKAGISVPAHGLFLAAVKYPVKYFP